MPEFMPTNQDVCFRKADITSNEESAFTALQQGKRVVYMDNVVLEVKNQEGNSRLVYRDNFYNPKELSCRRTGDNLYWIDKTAQYMARVCIADDSGMEYAIPQNLPTHKGPAGEVKDSCEFFIAYTGRLKIRGDKFFNKVFSITMR